MSIGALSAIVASQRNVSTRGGSPSPGQLLETIGAYIPTELSTAYIAAAGGIATIDPRPDALFMRNLAIGLGVLSMFITLVAAHRTAREKHKADKPDWNLWDTIADGWYEILASGVAFFVWATAMPGGWFEFGKNVVWAPALIVLIATVVVGGIAVLLDRDKRESDAVDGGSERKRLSDVNQSAGEGKSHPGQVANDREATMTEAPAGSTT